MASRQLQQDMKEKGKPQVDKRRSADGKDTLTLGETQKPPHDSTFNGFKQDEFVQSTQVMKLHIAARDNNAKSVKKSLDKGVSVYSPDSAGRSVLHWAVVFCKPAILEAFLQLFPVTQLDITDRNGRTSLHYAVLAGRANATNMLLKAGCNIHAVDNQGRTPLHYAAQNANPSVVLLLLRRGADPSFLDKGNRSPYDVAKEYNNTEIILEYLQLKPSKTPQYKQQSMQQETKEMKQSSQRKNGFETLEEAVVVSMPVEIIKEEMERDAERMKHELQKMKTRKEPLSDEKQKEQEQALHRLLNRSKRKKNEERRNKLARAERLVKLSRNRTMNTTPKALSSPQSAVGIGTSKESSAPCKTHEVDVEAESQVQINEMEKKSFDAHAAEFDTQKTNSETTLSCQPTSGPQDERNEDSKVTSDSHPAYMQRWFMSTLTEGRKSFRTQFSDTDICCPASPVSPPVRMEELQNFNSKSSTSFNPRTASKEHKNSCCRSSTPSTSSYRSPASPHYDANCPGTKPSSPPSNPPGVMPLEQNVRQKFDPSPSKGKNSKLQPNQRSYAEIASKALRISFSGGKSDNTKFQQPTSSEPECHGQGSAHSFLKAQENKKRRKKSASPNTGILLPMNRHGLECFYRPKAIKTKEICTSADHKWQQQQQKPWSPDEPWRPGGISTTVLDFKLNSLMKKEHRKAGGSICSMYHQVVKGKLLNDEDINSDPFANSKPHTEDDASSKLPLGKVTHQQEAQEALWSLRETSHQPLCESEAKELILSLRETKSSSGCMLAEAGPKVKADSGLTSEGMLMMAKTRTEPNLRLNRRRYSKQRKVTSYSETVRSKNTQTLSPKPLHPIQMSLQYAYFLQQEQRQSSSCSTSNVKCPPEGIQSSSHQVELSSYSSSQAKCPPEEIQSSSHQVEFGTLVQPPDSAISYPPANSIPTCDRYHSVVREPQNQFCEQDACENRATKFCSRIDAAINDRQSVNAVSEKSMFRDPSRHCLLKRIAPERYALLNYYGQSVSLCTPSLGGAKTSATYSSMYRCKILDKAMALIVKWSRLADDNRVSVLKYTLGELNHRG